MNSVAVSVRPWLRKYAACKIRPGRSKIKALVRFFEKGPRLYEVFPGVRMQLDLSVFDQEKVFYFQEEIEPGLQWSILKLLPEGGVFVDVGANAGFFSFFSAYHRHARVFLCEPFPALVSKLQASILDYSQSGNAGQLQLFPCAISNENGQSRFTTNSSSGATYHLTQEMEGTVNVDVQRLEFLFAEGHLSEIDFLKIDAEGFDLQVLQGLGEFLTPRLIKAIHIEANEQRAEVVKLMSDRGYQGYETINLDFYPTMLRKKAKLPFIRKMSAQGNPNMLFVPANSTVDLEFEKLLSGSD